MTTAAPAAPADSAPSASPGDLDRLIGAASPATARILGKALAGGEVSVAEGEALFAAHGPDREALLATSDWLRARAKGDRVSFVVTRNINFTNVCYMGCRFCNFAKRIEDGAAEFLALDEVARRAQQARDRGATEVCIQGGLHPKLAGTHYGDILRAIKAQVPDIHIHAFSPFEIWYGASKLRQDYERYLADLKDSGLGSIPGTAAEILDTEVRQRLTKNKLSADEWVTIIRAAHRVGLKSTATIMYGHVDGPRHWAAHLGLLRDIQKQTGGFTELVPLGFIHEDSPLYTQSSDVRPGPTEDENLKMHAVARIMLAGWIDNIQVSWVKLGPELAQRILRSGANDLGGTLMNESISRAAGAKYGQEITPREMADIIRGAGRVPVQRTTLYDTIADYAESDPPDYAPLVPRTIPSAAELLAKAARMQAKGELVP
jgi:FO synthase